DGKQLVDDIGKLENLQEDFDLFCQKVGIRVALPHKNKSRKKHDYKKYYDNKTRDIVARRFRRDIETFGYTFD
ncbi:MAG: sulfotransferase family protein, partial [Desulfobulbaceae bacterium]|nr:sulfotransferase family protein [Desulfobulbaceae bacterium]